MANHKSADKRARQTTRKTAVNTKIRSTVKTFEKKTLQAIKEGNSEEAQKLFKDYSSKIDRAAKRGVYHANKASRKISRIASKISGLSA